MSEFVKKTRHWLAENWLKLMMIIVIGIGIKLIFGAYYRFYQFITESPNLF